MTEGKSIGNVNVLDIRKTSEEAIAQIRRIRNVNIVLYSPATASYLGRLDIGNVNASLEIPADVELKTTMGNVRLSPETVSEGGPAMFHLVMGNVIVERGAQQGLSGEFLRSIAGLTVMGNVICPESVAGALEPKIKQLMGNLITYPDDATLVVGPLELTSGLLEGIDEATGFVVTGSVLAVDPLPTALMAKIDFLQARGTILCAEENADLLRSKLRGGKGTLTIIPSGYRLRQGDLLLDAATVGSLDAARLFCTGTVTFGEDLEPEAVERGLGGVRGLGLIVCPERLKESVSPKLDLVADRAVFYEGTLWLFDKEHTLHASRFEYSEGKFTVLVTGELHIEPDVEPSVLADRFLAVHNLGEILCSPDQMGAIEARLGIQEGEIVDSKPKEKEEFDIGNANVLTL
ncbi:MAG: hypothetical protein JSW65_07480 [Candidatus Bipolaricaulota bacterium]|nr:MAG: hypothetical protein JSW65_07480 [Candidatus Bipolaricaulota bacterium]